MQKTAVFVDAGYLFAQGSAALSADQAPVKRELCSLNTTAVLTQLRALASATPTQELLRIYWYDGAAGAPSAEQLALAKSDNVKLRLGIINNFGQQKGVDALIITDLIELARNHAIDDAILLSGDEDVRAGVSIAQAFGVRVHLLGIDCAGRTNQSSGLSQEADTSKCWSAADVGAFLTLTNAQPGVFANHLEIQQPAAALNAEQATAALKAYVAVFVAALTPHCATACKASPKSVIREVDGLLLGLGGRTVGRNLEAHEKRLVRQEFLAIVTRV
ncbi:NYN domain-containing protein [Trinickia acidisoli]|uniref:NYN domain-containing protein n=1 Tax=Trinickia acidisoli TaxID=2767482 RepID=UPI001A8DF3DD|nr:NYN domain-containing protein [Trinickia acidisoli]